MAKRPTSPIMSFFSMEVQPLPRDKATGFPDKNPDCLLRKDVEGRIAVDFIDAEGVSHCVDFSFILGVHSCKEYPGLAVLTVGGRMVLTQHKIEQVKNLLYPVEVDEGDVTCFM
jgi:hypothetical protein